MTASVGDELWREAREHVAHGEVAERDSQRHPRGVAHVVVELGCEDLGLVAPHPRRVEHEAMCARIERRAHGRLTDAQHDRSEHAGIGRRPVNRNGIGSIQSGRMRAQPLRPRALGVVKRSVRQPRERSKVTELRVHRGEIDGDLLRIGAEVARLFHQDGTDAKGAARREIATEGKACLRITRCASHGVVVQRLRREHASDPQQIIRAREHTLGLEGCGGEKRNG